MLYPIKKPTAGENGWLKSVVAMIEITYNGLNTVYVVHDLYHPNFT